MYKLAVLGDSEAILIFRAIGCDTFLVDEKNAGDQLKKLVHSNKYAVIFLSEGIAEMLNSDMEELDRRPMPAITVIPMGLEKKSTGLEKMRQVCIRATGTDLLSKM